MPPRLDRNPEAEALRLLRQFDIGGPRTPVEAIAAGLRIAVELRPLPSHTSGMLIRDDNDQSRAWIVVREQDNDLRRRFTIAHELGHLRLHVGRPLLLETSATHFSLNERRTGGEVPSPYEEAQANRFAAELLMPRSTVELLFISRYNRVANEGELLKTLASAFEVSSSAMQYRLVNLGLMLPSKG
jgi:Zn-dependent peptidase ImmA (M78 family)